MKDNRTMLSQMHPNCRGCEWEKQPWSNEKKVYWCSICSDWNKNKNYNPQSS